MRLASSSFLEETFNCFGWKKHINDLKTLEGMCPLWRKVMNMEVSAGAKLSSMELYVILKNNRFLKTLAARKGASAQRM